jgi:hypothetical protein
MRKSKRKEDGENYVTGSFKFFTLLLTLYLCLNQGVLDGYDKQHARVSEKLIQNFSRKILREKMCFEIDA